MSLPASAVTDAIQNIARSSIRKVAAYEQLETLLMRHIEETRAMFIFENEKQWHVQPSDGRYIDLFVSVSLVACIEWALKQPYAEKKETNS